MLIEPVLTALVAIPLAGEPLTPGLWIGGLISLIGIYLINRSRETTPSSAESEGVQPTK